MTCKCFDRPNILQHNVCHFLVVYSIISVFVLVESAFSPKLFLTISFKELSITSFKGKYVLTNSSYHHKGISLQCKYVNIKMPVYI